MYSDGRLQPITSFDFDEIDERLGWSERKEDSVSFSDMSAAFSLVLGNLIGRSEAKPRSMAMVGALVHTLQFFLDPTNCRFDSLAEIAAEANCTRQALSSWLMALRDQLDVCWQLGKPQGTREAYREGQLAALERGTHVSQRRREKAGAQT